MKKPLVGWLASLFENWIEIVNIYQLSYQLENLLTATFKYLAYHTALTEAG